MEGQAAGGEGGQKNIDLLRAYWRRIEGEFPKRPDGEPDIKAIAAASGINRSAFYSNKGLKHLLDALTGQSEAPADDQGLRSQYQVVIQRRDERILHLEQRLAAAEAEAETLREAVSAAQAKLSRFRELEAILVEKGMVLD